MFSRLCQHIFWLFFQKNAKTVKKSEEKGILHILYRKMPIFENKTFSALEQLVRQDPEYGSENQCRQEICRLELTDLQQSEAYHQKKHPSLRR